MNILWLVNITLPEASILLNEKPTPYGGWLIRTSDYISLVSGYKLFIAFPSHHVDQIKLIQGKDIDYICFSPKEANLSKHLHEVLKMTQPNLVHIFGTEYPHSLSMIECLKYLDIPHLLTLQGLTSVIHKHYLDGLPEYVIRRSTFRDFLRNDSLKKQQQRFYQKSRAEIQALALSKYVTGRTTFDFEVLKKYSPDSTYFSLNESLRKPFYEYAWDIHHIDRYTLMTSQAYYPIKGFHYLIEAVSMLKEVYPQIKIKVTGEPIHLGHTLLSRVKQSSYSRYISELINTYDLNDHIEYLGVLNADEMVHAYLKSHVFVIPSSIENSSNALSEAMILGVPSIASFVGGSQTMLTHQESGLHYPYDAPHDLKDAIAEIFEHDELALSLSKGARQTAVLRHDIDINNQKLLEIYQHIIKK